MTRKIILNDVSLRESAQVSGGAMTLSDQLTYVRLLLEGGIDRIEVGFPGSSAEQLAQSKKIVDFVKSWSGEKPLLSGLARAEKKDIDAIKEAGCDYCHIYIPASDEFVQAMFSAEKYGDTLEGKQQWIIDTALKMIQYARSLGFMRIEYSPEDASRTSFEFLFKVVETAIKAGADIINIPDTTGLRIGSEFGDLITAVKVNVPNISQAVISVHCHNDSDHGAHNALQAILAGADIVEGNFYGLGERSGMTKFESIIMNINTRRDIFAGIEIDFDPSLCVTIVNFVANALGMPVPRHWPVVGPQNAICSSGTHQAIEAKTKEQGGNSGYYSWNPANYGHGGGVETVINQSSGRAGLAQRLKSLGHQVSRDDFQKVYDQTIRISEAKGGKPLSDRELVAIVQDVITDIPYFLEIKKCQAIGGEGTIPTATVIMDVGGKQIIVPAIGDGPYDAIMKAVIQAASQFYPVLGSGKITLDDWRPVPITRGAEALADVYARICISNGEDQIFSGRSVHLDTNQASAQAFANCLSWYLASIL